MNSHTSEAEEELEGRATGGEGGGGGGDGQQGNIVLAKCKQKKSKF